MQDCQKCKDYRDCVGKPWYSYADYRWCPWQVIWVIENAEIMRRGNWPLDPDKFLHTDPQIRSGYRSEASYVKAVIILAEVELRLTKAGVRGKLLRAEILAGLELSQESWNTLMYVQGRRRKRMSYSDWLKQRKYRGSNEAVF